MASILKTYIIDAPWRAILLYGLFFALFAGGVNLLIDYKNGGGFTTGTWYGELGMWYVVGMFVKYVTWRAEGALARKNARWKARKK